ncbi:MAG: fibronectin type III domain-containing protein [Thermoplasmatota archaeon]
MIITSILPAESNAGSGEMPEMDRIQLPPESDVDSYPAFEGGQGFFTENLGQINGGGIRYYWVSDSLSMGFSEGGVRFNIIQGDHGWSYEMTFHHSEGSPPVGLEPTGSCSSYFIGNDENMWVRRARHFGSVHYDDIYPGIDIDFKLNGGNLKYDIFLEPGADPENIRFLYQGADAGIVEGDLHLTTPLGTIMDEIPLSYQDSIHDIVDVNWTRYPDGSIGFLPDEYDPDRRLVIDPNIVLSSYIGGGLGEAAWGLEVDDSGYIYLGGYTSSTDFPTTAGAFDTDVSSTDVFVMKINPDTRELIYSTYIGGSGIDLCYDLALDSGGNAYVTGLVGLGGSGGDDFPTTPDAFDATFNGGEDVIVVKLNPNGDDLVYSTFVGGAYYDFAYGIAVDGEGCAYVTGGTQSDLFPLTDGALKTSRNWDDAFLFKLNSEGSDLVYSTFWGGWTNDRGEAVAVDSEGCAYITGFTYAENMPTTPGAFDRDYNGDGANGDCFLTKFNETGTGLVYSTYFGGSGSDWGKEIFVHDDGRVTICGDSSSNNLPTTSDAHSRTKSGYKDAFVVEFNHLGSRLNYATYIGGSEGESAEDVLVDATGCVNIVGNTNSKNFPTTLDADDRTFDGYSDAFITRIGTDGEIAYSSFIGGSGSEFPRAMHLDPEGESVYFAGHTNSTDFPLLDPFDDMLENGADAFLVRYVTEMTVDAPSNLTADAGDEYVLLRWERPFVHPMFSLKGYNLYSGDLLENMSLLSFVEPDAMAYNDTGLRNGLVRYYYITAVIEGGEGIKSGTILATPRTVPEPPKDVFVTGGFRWVKISWDVPDFNGGSPILHYRVFRGFDPGNMTEIHTAGKYSFSYNDTNLEYGCLFYYGVKAENAAGNGSFSEISSIRIGHESTEPTNIKAVLSGPLKILVSWGHPGIDYNLTIISYRVARSVNGSDYSQVNMTDGIIHNYTDGNVTAGYVYRYAVSAINCKGESNQVTTDPVTAMRLPGIVYNFTKIDGDRTVDLSWDYDEDEAWEKVSYRLYAGNTSNELEPIRDLDETSFRIEGLDNGKDYVFAVSVINQMGEGGIGPFVTATPFTIPTTPININFTRKPGEVILTWEAPKFDGGRPVMMYIIELEHSNAGAPFAEMNHMPGPLPVNQTYQVFIDEEYLEIGSEYNFRVKAVNQRGAGPVSSTVTTIFATIPGSPYDLGEGEVQGMFVRINWNEPLDKGGIDITGYKIFRDGIEIGIVDGSTFFYDDHNVTDGSSYRYRVCAVNPVGDGEISEELVIVAYLTGGDEPDPNGGPHWIFFLIIPVVIILLGGLIAMVIIVSRKGKKREIEDKPIGGTRKEAAGEDEISQIYSELGLEYDYKEPPEAVTIPPAGEQASVIPQESQESAAEEIPGIEDMSFNPPDLEALSAEEVNIYDPLSVLATLESDDAIENNMEKTDIPIGGGNQAPP